MIIQSLWRGNSPSPSSNNNPPLSRRTSKFAYGIDMGAPCDEVVAIRLGQNRGDPSVITINCPDQLGLGCDLTRIIFEFGLSVVRLDLSTDGRWFFVIFWVTPKAGSSPSTRWAVLKKRLVAACPLNRAPMLLPLMSQTKPKESYILQFCASDRPGLLNDVSQALWELELIVHKLKVTTSPAGKAIGLLYITDTKDTLHSKKREEDVRNRLRTVIGDSSSSVDLLPAGHEWGGLECGPVSSLLLSVTDLLSEGEAELESHLRTSTDDHGVPLKKGSLTGDSATSHKASVTTDNSLSPGHTLLQISCQDRKGLLYDIMRTLKDFNIQIAYGRLSTTPKRAIEIDLFILQADGKKIVDPVKQKTFCTRLQMEIMHPIRVMVVNRGPDTELLVATPIEINGRGRPKVLFDTTLALKMLDVCIFKVDMGRYTNGEKQWEVYRFLLIDKVDLALANSRTRSHIEERVSSVLLG